MNLRNSKIYNIMLMIMVSILLLIIINFYNHNLYSIGILAIISYCMFFLSWWRHYKIKLNFYTIFLAFTLAFFWGQFILLLLGIPLDSGRVLLDGRIPYNKLIETGILILNSMFLLHLGVLFSTLKINKYNDLFYNNSEKINVNHKNNDSLKKVGYILLLISILPSFYVLFNNLIITMTQGYGAIFQSEMYTTGGFNNITRFLSLFTMPSFLMLFITCKNDKSLKYLTILFTVYLSLYFVSGSRMGGLMLLSIMFLVKHYWYKPIKIKEIATKYIFIFIIGITLMSTISEVRNIFFLQDSIRGTFVDGVKNVFLNNPIFSILREMGFTFIATATVITYSPSVVPYAYGQSYINSVLMIFPNLFWDVHPAALTNTDIVFKNFYTQYGGIGSSFIAEAYWNFGYFSIILALVFGVIIGTLTKQMAKYAANRNTRMFFLVVYALQVILTYVRSDTITFWRNFTYYGVLPVIVAWLLSHFYKSSRVRQIK